MTETPGPAPHADHPIVIGDTGVLTGARITGTAALQLRETGGRLALGVARSGSMLPAR